MRGNILFVAAWIFGTACAALGADPTSAPTSAPAGAASAKPVAMRIFVAEVKGLVQVRDDPSAAWKGAAVGMELGPGAELRTGPRSSITCEIPPDQTLVLDRLGTLRIDQAIRSGHKIKTDMTMKYGRTRYDIETAGAEHESTIRSPGSTLAVRGTFVSLYDQPPYTVEADSFHGRAEFRDAHRQMRFGGTQFTQISADKHSPADTKLARQVIDPTSVHALTQSEQRYVADQTSKSALFSFDDFAAIPVIRNGPAPLTDSQLLASVPSLPGALDIVLRWQGNANMNLVVGDQAGTDPIALLSNFKPTEFLYPGFGLNRSSAGGFIPYDNQGGANGGMEIAYWKGNYPHGLYGISAVHESGGPALATLDVFLNGKQLDNLTTFQVDSSGNQVTDPATGFPILVKNNQITRPVNAYKSGSAAFGPNAGVTSVLDFIPAVPAFDDPKPVEPPVTFPPPDSGKKVKSSEKSAGGIKSNAGGGASAPTSHQSSPKPGRSR